MNLKIKKKINNWNNNKNEWNTQAWTKMVPSLANMDAKDFDLIFAVSATQQTYPNRTDIETEPDRNPLLNHNRSSSNNNSNNKKGTIGSRKLDTTAPKILNENQSFSLSYFLVRRVKSETLFFL